MTLQNIKDDPTISNWLKTSLETALERDPVDAVRDASQLLKLLENTLWNVQMSSILRNS